MRSCFDLAYRWWEQWLPQADRAVSPDILLRITRMKAATRQKNLPEVLRLVNVLRQFDRIFNDVRDRIVMKVEIAWAMRQIGQTRKAIELLEEAKLLSYPIPDLLGWIHQMIGCLNWEAYRFEIAFQEWNIAKEKLESFALSYSDFPPQAGWILRRARRIITISSILATSIAAWYPTPIWLDPSKNRFFFPFIVGPGLDVPVYPGSARFFCICPRWTCRCRCRTRPCRASSVKKSLNGLTPAVLHLFNFIDSIPAGWPLRPIPLENNRVETDRLTIAGNYYRIYSLDGRRVFYFSNWQDYFVLKVHSNSMNLRGISDGDYVLVRKTQQAQNGDIVAAGVKGGKNEATLKVYLRDRDDIYLVFRSDQRGFQAEEIEIENPDRDLAIWGIVIAVLKLS